jgi:hypothetical protein
VKENKLEGSIPRPANEGPTTCEMPEAAGALEAGVREIETAYAIEKHEADSSSDWIAMVYDVRDVKCLTNKRRLCKENKKRQKVTTALLNLILEETRRRSPTKVLVRPSNNQDRDRARTLYW